jgi:hypothetical protein
MQKTQIQTYIAKSVKGENGERTKLYFKLPHLKLHRRGRKIHIGIYQKPTQTNITIHNTSNHPAEHKHAADNYILYLSHKG